MCGIVGLVRAFDADARLSPLQALDAARGELARWLAADRGAADDLAAVASGLEPVSRALVGWAGFQALREDAACVAAAGEVARALEAAAAAVDARLAGGGGAGATSSREGEALARAAVVARDVAWRLERDALPNVALACGLLPGGDLPAGPAGAKAAFEAWRLNLILNQLGRLEVRGRDSGGLGVLVALDGPAWAEAEAELAGGALAAELRRREAVSLLRDGAVLSAPLPGGGRALAFAHKVAREVGELGANVRDLRARLAADGLLWALASRGDARVQAFAHTRWASNGVISEPNCHPVANDLAPGAPLARLVLAALNGDVDNHLALAAGHAIPAEVTTDAKVIPLELARRLAAPGPGGAAPALEDAFVAAAGSFQGSTAVVAVASDDPDAALLALRGSGQALYVGLADDGALLYASELYGVVELAARYVKLDGEAGDVWALRPAGPGEDALARVVRRRLDGAPRQVAPGERKTAPIATRDIDRGGASHYLLKEITQAPSSVERTLRGKFVLEGAERARFLLGDEVIPPAVRAAMDDGTLRRVWVIGQGTAAVAGQAFGEVMAALLRPAEIAVRALPATELSGFHLEHLGPQDLIVAVSQSGTTTDTNRTVDLARERGAHVLAIVNRRGSDLADKAHGVLYTSDGRDVEMSVASTKAFYCQVVAGYLLGLQLAQLAGALAPRELAARLLRLADLPRCLRVVLEEGRERIRQAAQLALRHRHWTVCGSGPGLHAARETRIKLSELCYKSVAVDTIEDKKHIDLSSEPMILVCAAGLGGAAAADAVKEVGIYRAHAATPVVICDRGETRFADYAAATIEVPAASPEVALLLNTVAGHLFSFETARAIDRLTDPLRRVRETAEAAWDALHDAAARGAPAEQRETLERLRAALRKPAREVLAAIEQGTWDAGAGPGTALRVERALRVAQGYLPLREARPEAESPSPREVVALLLAEVTHAIDALRRPIDAIKHQAKTVTVGISREQVALRPEPGPLVRALEAAGVDAAALADPDAAALAGLEAVVEAAPGVVRYELTGLDPLGAPTERSALRVVAKAGAARDMPSRADRGAPLTGTKRAVVRSPRVWVGRGQRDASPLVLCPLYREGALVGLGLLHVRFKGDAGRRERVRALRSAGRYEDLRCAVTEGDVPWDDALLDGAPLEDLLTAPVDALARALTDGRAGAPPVDLLRSSGAAPRPGQAYEEGA